MTSQFEHLNLPKTDIQLPRRKKPGGGGGTKRSDRSSHGHQLLTQLASISQRPRQKVSSFRLDPKLIFKIKLNPDKLFTEAEIRPIGLTFLAQEPKVNKAIVVFASDDALAQFQTKLENYSGIQTDYQYDYLDAIDELVPLEPSDRIGRLLQLEPLSPGEITPLDLELWHTGDRKELQTAIDTIDDVLRDLSSGAMRVSDRYIGEYLCVARIKVNDEMLDLLLGEELVKEIDRRPKPSFETPSQYNVSFSDLPNILPPSDETCGVLIFDSGVRGGQPLIAPALGDSAVFPDPGNRRISDSPDDSDKRTGGHGTGVAGIAIYGDIQNCIKTRSFEPKSWLFSARVTDQNNEYDPDFLIESQLEDAIEYFTRNYPTCKVINISLGDARLVFQDGQKQFRLAAKIDEIAHRYQHKNLLFVISAGNFYYQSDSNERFLTDYPGYLLSEEARIIDPATSAIALTVGSISMGTGSMQYPDDASRRAVARCPGYPSPFTRTGFGVDGMIKPDLVDFGGDFVVDRDRVIDSEPGVGIITLARNDANSLFSVYCGTSFSAPRVANLAAQLYTQYPNATSNLIRALTANSAVQPSEIPALLEGKEPEHIKNRLRVYGYGQPDLRRARYSSENYVVLQVDNEEIPVGSFRLYEIPPLPEEFFMTRGSRALAITLAFDPPTRPSRGDSYLGVTMEFRLFKNIKPEIITEAFVQTSSKNQTEEFTKVSLKDLEQQYGAGIQVKLSPGSQLRNKSTLQKGQIDLSSRATGYIQSPLYLVVSCARKWAKEGEVDTQRFALLASVEHSDPKVDLYNRLRSQIDTRVRIR
jgi:hypothetical protein